jgi:hypothetical protein
MSTTTPSNSPKRSVSPVALLGAVVVIAAVAVLGFFVLGGDDDKAKTTANAGLTERAVRFNGPEKAPFRLTVPPGWVRVEQKVIEKAGEVNTMAVRNANGTGVVSVRVNGPVKQSLTSLQSELNAKMKTEAPKMKLDTSKVLDVKAGPALYTAWNTAGGKTLQTNLVVPAGKLSYTLDAVIDAKDRKTAREVGLILRAFDAKR